MKKLNKIFALILSIVMIALIFPIGVFAEEEEIWPDVEVYSYSDLQNALYAARSGTTIVFCEDYVLKKSYDITKNITLDLDGHTISASSSIKDNTFMFNIPAGVTVTIQNGKIKNSYGRGISTYGKLTIKGISSNTATRGLAVLENGVATVDKNSSFSASGTDCPVYIIGGSASADTGKKPVLNYYGKAANTGSGPAIYLSTVNVGSPTVNIYSGANVTAAKNVAIRMSSVKSTVNISGGTFTGTSAVALTAGTLNISGGTFTGNGAYKSLSSANVASGTFSNGSAVTLLPLAKDSSVASSNSAVNKVSVSISGSPSFKSSSSHTINEVELVKGVSSIEKLTIKGGRFISAASKDSVLVTSTAASKTSITRGVFSTDPSDYVASSIAVAAITSGSTTLYYVGVDATNSIKSLKSGNTVRVMGAMKTLTLPEGVNVKNRTGSAITVNGVSLANNKDMVAGSNVIKAADPGDTGTASTASNSTSSDTASSEAESADGTSSSDISSSALDDGTYTNASQGDELEDNAPSSEDNATAESGDLSFVIWIVAGVVVIAAGAAATLIILKKKK